MCLIKNILNLKKNKLKDDFSPELGLENVVGIFYILILILVISIIVAAFEVLYKSKLDAGKPIIVFNIFNTRELAELFWSESNVGIYNTKKFQIN